MYQFEFKDMQNDLLTVNNFYKVLKHLYPQSSVSTERQKYLSDLMNEYGYIPYPYVQTFTDLTDAEVLFCLEKKWENENVLSNGEFKFSDTSVLARNDVKDSSWIKREGHDIKLINMGGLGDGNNNKTEVSFMNWLRQLVILPTGNKENNIFSTTIYLIPFHHRRFECAYIPQTSHVDDLLEDKNIAKLTNLNADAQMKLFIQLAQLAGHPVIYDVLPQTARFSKLVMMHPECVRWYDVKALINKLCSKLTEAQNDINSKMLSQELRNKYSHKDLSAVIDIYKDFLGGAWHNNLSEYYQQIFADIDNDKNLVNYKKLISNFITEKTTQDKIHAKAKEIIHKTLNKPLNVELKEEDITDLRKLEAELVKVGLWPSPCGCWNSSGVPVFDKMYDKAQYPLFKHYSKNGEDVTEMAALTCQAPFYFVCLENGQYNENVIKLFVDYQKDLQRRFHFDGFRVDHVDHVLGENSESDGVPISYNAPRKAIKALNDEMKKEIPYFASIAEFMMWQPFYKEYHEEMNFDLLWGSDIYLQDYKNPYVISQNNHHLANYNVQNENLEPLSIIKMYNNQDGEYRYINKFPAALGKKGALFKWFELKFLPYCPSAQRPVMYVDGDESFSIGGIERTINNEVFMKRNTDFEFFAKFDAIDRFVKNNSRIVDGASELIRNDKDGFVAWLVGKPNDDLILVVAKFSTLSQLNDAAKQVIKNMGLDKKVINKTVETDPKFEFVSEYKFDGKNYVEEEFESPAKEIFIDEIETFEFRFFRVAKAAQ